MPVYKVDGVEIEVRREVSNNKGNALDILLDMFIAEMFEGERNQSTVTKKSHSLPQASSGTLFYCLKSFVYKGILSRSMA